MLVQGQLYVHHQLLKDNTSIRCFRLGKTATTFLGDVYEQLWKLA